jgi:hypothetical protein
MPDAITEELVAARALGDAVKNQHLAWIAFTTKGGRLSKYIRAFDAMTAACEAYDIARAANPWRPGQAVTLEHARLATAQIRAASAKRYWLERAVDVVKASIEDDRTRRYAMDAIRALLTAEDPAPIDVAAIRRAALEEAAAAIYVRVLDHGIRAGKLPKGSERAMETELGCEAARCWQVVRQMVENS